jgi:hypothetical protein
VDERQGDAKDFYRCGFRAVQQRWLECGAAPALRTPLAGLLRFATAFCNGAKPAASSLLPGEVGQVDVTSDG